MARPSKPWYWKARDAWCVDLDGRRHVLAKGRAAKPEATAEFHRLMASLGRRELVAPARLTTADLFDLFLDAVDGAVARGERARSTYDGYVRFLSPAADRFGAIRAAELTPYRVHQWVEATAPGWGPTTRANAITAVKAAFRWARRQGLVREDPVTDMEKPTSKRRTAVLSPEQGRAILEAAEGPFRRFLTCLWLTGCRPGELATLEASGVDPAGGILHVRDKIRRTTGKDTREVHAVPAAMAILAGMCEDHPDGPIFRNRLGRPWTRNAMTCAMRRIRRKTGLGAEAVPYSFRHLFGTDALEAGVHVAIVAELMGHRNATMLMQRYAHLDGRRDTLREAARTIRPGEHDAPLSASGGDAPAGGSPPPGA